MGSENPTDPIGLFGWQLSGGVGSAPLDSRLDSERSSLQATGCPTTAPIYTERKDPMRLRSAISD